VGPDALNLPSLLARLANGTAVREVIVATNPSVEGEATAHYVERTLRQTAPAVAVSRLARGLPVGGELEYADGETIAQAFSARRKFSGE
jgi:recombination protein RecR